jgi:hypothetical protein
VCRNDKQGGSDLIEYFIFRLRSSPELLFAFTSAVTGIMIGVSRLPQQFKIILQNILLLIIIISLIWHEARFVNSNVPFIVSRRNGEKELVELEGAMRKNNMKLYPFETMEALGLDLRSQLHIEIGELEEALEEKIEELKRTGTKIWIPKIENITTHFISIKNIFLYKKSKYTVNLGFSSVPVALAFALGYTLGVPGQLNVWHKPRGGVYKLSVKNPHLACSGQDHAEKETSHSNNSPGKSLQAGRRPDSLADVFPS